MTLKNNQNELEGSGAAAAEDEEVEAPVLRWKITNYDPETTESPDDIESELQRLKALKSYHLLDIEPQKAYNEVVEYASRIFEGHVSIQLVDLERVWCLAGTGPLTPPHELPRRESMCAHVILAKPSSEAAVAVGTCNTSVVYTPLVVADLSQDTRFQHFPTVIGAPFWRFYAGMPLINGDGVKLGSLCVFDTKPRNCWDPDQSEMLTQLAGIVVSLMEEHRAALPPNKQDDENNNKNNTNSPTEEEEDLIKGQSVEQEFKKRKINCSDDMHEEDNGDKGNTADNENWVTAVRKDNRDTKRNQQQQPSSRPKTAVGIVTTIQIRTFVKILEEVMGEFPKKADLVFVVDPSLPEELVFNDLKVFRSAIALLTSACERTVAGQVSFSVFARPSQSTLAPPYQSQQLHQQTTTNNRINQNEDLVMECKDTAPNIPVEWYPYLFEETNQTNDDESTDNDHPDSMQYSVKASEVNVRGVAHYISTIEGARYGFAPRRHEEEEEGNNPAAASLPSTGSVFWFSVPLVVMENIVIST
jgi:hypothetical protein